MKQQFQMAENDIKNIQDELDETKTDQQNSNKITKEVI